MYTNGEESGGFASFSPGLLPGMVIVAIWLLALVIWNAAAHAQESAAPPENATPANGMAAAMSPDDEMERTYLAPWLSRPTLVQVAIVNATASAGLAGRVSVLLTDVRRVALEKQIGMRVDVVNASSTGERLKQSVIYYREGFLRAALSIAEELPRDQRMEPMTPEQARRRGVDVEIWLGGELP